MLNKKRYIHTLYIMLKTYYKTVKILYIIYNVKKLFKNIYTVFTNRHPLLQVHNQMTQCPMQVHPTR